MRSILPVAGLILAMGCAWAGADTCERCGGSLDSPGAVTVTDWTTNSTHQYHDLSCAVEKMAARFPWSRASLSSAVDGKSIALTHTAHGWQVSPSGALLIPMAMDSAGKCVGFVAVRSDDEARRFLDENRPLRDQGVQPIGLLDYAVRFQVADASHDGAAPEATIEPPSSIEDDSTPAAGDHWAAAPARNVVDEGLMALDADGSFDGDRAVTRAEMAVILNRLMDRSYVETDGAESSAVTPPADVERQAAFADLPADHWAYPAVAEVVRAGLMRGYPDGTFRGGQPMTRYEIAAILSRLLPMLAPADAQGPDDRMVETPAAAPIPPAEPTVTNTAIAPAVPAHPAPTSPEALVAPLTTADAQDSVSFLGQSGYFLVPDSRLLSHLGRIHGFVTTDGANFFESAFRLDDRTDISIADAVGAGFDRVMLNAKYDLGDLTRVQGLSAAVGVIDAFDEVDLSPYAVFTKRFPIRTPFLNRPSQLQVSLGVGGGNMLDGTFGGLLLPLSPRLAAIADYADSAGGKNLNWGLSYRVDPRWDVKLGSVRGTLGGSINFWAGR
jgi:hypothetical protein